MSYDPHREDYQRLGLRFARSLDGKDPAAATRAFASFSRRFSQNRDSLPQSDADRAFHLVAEAATLIDYELPFADDDHAEQLIDQGHHLLDEAIALDERCHDAIRMKQAAESHSFESYYDFLASNADSVRASCEEARAQTHDESPERALLEADIAMRPYYRWLATQAGKAVICGRNREAIRLGEKLLDLDPQDSSDVRFTCAIAYAKLEDEAGLERFAARTKPLMRAGTEDAWMQLARISLAHKRHDMDEASRLLGRLIGSYPHAALALTSQKELPDGVFARLAVAPLSEDELILAVSEGTVLLQEGRDDAGRGVLGTWVARHAGLGSSWEGRR
ncbi:MAG: response regulator receiver protein [Atopobiaceae bacterium]|nr:response regulator receiver protein [Atopobiaceae bacterium]